jgi:D-beta-D-heptose 7-phosphate kinase/D-beta-D-heptose 1-phosphate adenosyltransferase
MISGYEIDRLGSGSVLVLGDVMLNEYIWGEVNRIFPEAPLQIVRVRERSKVLGERAMSRPVWLVWDVPRFLSR